MPADGDRRRARWPWALVAYAVLLLASHLVRGARPEPVPPPGVETIELPAVRGRELVEGRVRLVYRDEGEGPVVLLIHGSPGSLYDFDVLGRDLAQHRRVLIPDLPGFGGSSRDIPDVSFLAHARYLEELLERLGVDRVHVVAFSLGGGVALHLQELAPERVDSIAFVASIGVQEMELLGNYELNHLVHGAQLVGITLLEEAVPHFGLLDGGLFDRAYARNFFDSDQRPLRGLLERIEIPFLIVHGRQDPLVPWDAAREHAQIVPQAELFTYEDRGHFLLWQETEDLAVRLAAFFTRVEAGQGIRRAEAGAARVAAARIPFAEVERAPVRGIALGVLLALLAFATLLSEDLACVAAGLLVADGRLAFAPGVLACFAGIYAGDLLLYGAGRVLGRHAGRRAPLRWFVSEASLGRARRWFERRGIVVVFLSRFLPGTRLPTYVVAGVLRASFWRFALWFLVAVALWTPALVGLASAVGQEALGLLQGLERRALPAFLLTAAVLGALFRIALPALTHDGRRLLLGRWRRLTRWEFWPAWILYLPVAVRVALLALRHRSLRLVTAVNPGIPEGGFIGESKTEILDRLAGAGERVARAVRLPSGEPPEERERRVRSFREENGLDYPVVLKPDAGERGTGVVIARSDDDVRRTLGEAAVDYLVQEWVPGPEWGVFWVHPPDEPKGRIFAITEKRLPDVVGDGVSTLERLILDDDRAVCLAPVHLAVHAASLDRVPAAGERVPLVELGTHCRGAVFLDGASRRTEALEAAVGEVSAAFEGFRFGRYDVRASSPEDFERGRFKVLELNGMTSEATNIYDHTLRDAYRILFEQWRLAFEIAAANRARGARPASWSAILGRIRSRLRR